MPSVTLIMTTIGWLMCEMLALLTIQAVYSKNGKIVHIKFFFLNVSIL